MFIFSRSHSGRPQGSEEHEILEMTPVDGLSQAPCTYLWGLLHRPDDLWVIFGVPSSVCLFLTNRRGTYQGTNGGTAIAPSLHSEREDANPASPPVFVGNTAPNLKARVCCSCSETLQKIPVVATLKELNNPAERKPAGDHFYDIKGIFCLR